MIFLNIIYLDAVRT